VRKNILEEFMKIVPVIIWYNPQKIIGCVEKMYAGGGGGGKFYKKKKIKKILKKKI
jgi:hypothetical protein